MLPKAICTSARSSAGHLKPETYLPVILLPTLYLGGPVVLLEEEDACKGVGERDLAEGQALVRPPEHLWGEAERSPDHESRVAAPATPKESSLRASSSDEKLSLLPDSGPPRGTQRGAA
jgi:hypothetical protein